MAMEFLKFPQDFAWGVATAAAQVEGAALEDGKGQSIWDTFGSDPKNIADGKGCGTTCDFYHRYRDDNCLMRTLLIQNHRMSIAWPRIFPDGTKSSMNESGLDFYDRLIDDMLSKGITPYITLFHWDLPQALQDKGGWTNRDTIAHFRDYADTVTRRLGDRVKNWMTINEPWVHTFCGHLFGCHAPGIKDLGVSLKVAHSILLAHAEGMEAIHTNVKDGRGGIVNNLAWCESATDSDEDKAATSRWDGAFNRWFMDPIFKGSYPADMVKWYQSKGVMPEVKAGDMEKIATAKGDLLGVNYYTRRLVTADPNNAHIAARQVYRPCVKRAGFDEFEVYPEGLYHVLKWVKDKYTDLPVYITENGTTLEGEAAGADGCVHDAERVEYYRRHFAAVWQAMKEGCPVKGYFVWSFMDNWEWGFGFTKRFGIVYTDYDGGLRRIPKDSAHFLSSVIARGGFDAD